MSFAFGSYGWGGQRAPNEFLFSRKWAGKCWGNGKNTVCSRNKKLKIVSGIKIASVLKPLN